MRAAVEWGNSRVALGQVPRNDERRLLGSASVASILIIEDEVMLARQLVRSLEASGYDVRSAPNAASGMEARATLEVVLAAYKSAITHQSVELPLSGDDPYYDGVLAALDPNTIHAKEGQNG